MPLVRIAIEILPFRWLIKLVSGTTSANNNKQRRIDNIKLVKLAITVVARYGWWENKCLANALTAKLLLCWFKINSRLYLGLSKQQGGLGAHAWLYAGDVAICGVDANMERYAVVAEFE